MGVLEITIHKRTMEHFSLVQWNQTPCGENSTVLTRFTFSSCCCSESNFHAQVENSNTSTLTCFLFPLTNEISLSFYIQLVTSQLHCWGTQPKVHFSGRRHSQDSHFNLTVLYVQQLWNWNWTKLLHLLHSLSAEWNYWVTHSHQLSEVKKTGLKIGL